MQTLTAGTLLRVWELGRERHPIDRGVLLHAVAAPTAQAEALADAPLGQRNRALLQLRRATFGPQLPAYLDCPSCGQRLELALDVATLLGADRNDAQGIAEDPRAPQIVKAGAWRFRLPTSRDLACAARLVPAPHDTDGIEAPHQAATHGGAGGATDTTALALLRACIVGPAALTDTHAQVSPAQAMPTKPELLALIPEVEAAFDAADPLADMAFDVHCAACGHAWSAELDVASFVWDEIDARARHLLDEVHLLASAYGWSESDILTLPESRRAAYLERVLA
jgi:hypothetical protein